LESISILEQARQKLNHIARDKYLMQEPIRVAIKPLSPRQAIGTPIRQDFPLLTGREIIVEAEFRRSYGQAFTDQPRIFDGSLQDVMQLILTEAGNRAIFLSTLNAVTSNLEIADRVRHCHDEEPENCAREITQELAKRFGKIRIGMVGYQPAILENLCSVFGPKHIRCTDLNPTNIGSLKFGAEIWDGAIHTSRLISWCDLALVTSSSLANGTFDDIYQESLFKEKKFIIFGITGAGISALMGLERLCFYGH